jgi:beta-lactamase superfamily II metal-dependent hydrolase
MPAMRMLLCLVLALVAPLGARDLEIYFVDVEGGQATLIVTPSGEAMLVDAGWPGNGGRDADRIAAAARSAGVKQIDYLVVTHHHLDHVGGVPPLAEKMPVRTFVDHGPNIETGKQAQALTAAYQKALAGGKHLVVKPGDRIPLKGVDVEVVAAGGERIASPVKGAGASNPACASAKRQEDDPSENARSVGFVLRHGNFRFVDLGDLTWNKELELACPSNRIGTADVFLVSHHGMDISNSPALVEAIRPRVAVMNNGAKKGGSPEAWRVVKKSPGLEDLWQLHYAVKAGAEANSPEQLIANPQEASCQGHWLKLTARADGSFTVTNSRNQYTKTYSARK